MASKIKDLAHLTPKCKGIDGRGDARERVQAAAKVLANAEARTLAGAVRLITAIAKNKKIRDLIKDELYDMGHHTHGTGHDGFTAKECTLEDVDYVDGTGLDTILDYIAAGAIIADSAVEARQDTDIEMKKLKEKVAETEKKPVDRVLRNMELNLKDIGKEKEKYDPYSSRPSRDESGRDERRTRDRDYDRDGRNERDRDRDYDRDKNRNERGNRDSRDRDYDRDYNRGERRRERRDETPRDRRDEYDSRGRETGYNADRDRVEGFGAELLSNFRRVIHGGR
jgi:hypothetical protein